MPTGKYKRTKEHREKIRTSLLGHPVSAETRKKIGLTSRGRKHTPETRERIRLAGLGRKHSLETRLKMSKFKMGVKPSAETREKLRKARLGKTISPEHRQKLSASLKGKPQPWNQGENNKGWKGGIGCKPYSYGFDKKLKRHIRARDDFKCRICGIRESGKAHQVHHIDYSKTNHKKANLVTLCRPCHDQTNTDRKKWIHYFRSQT